MYISVHNTASLRLFVVASYPSWILSKGTAHGRPKETKQFCVRILVNRPTTEPASHLKNEGTKVHTLGAMYDIHVHVHCHRFVCQPHIPRLSLYMHMTYDRNERSLILALITPHTYIVTYSLTVENRSSVIV